MNAKKNMYVNTKMHKKINEFINLLVILFLSDINECDFHECPYNFECENTEGYFNCNKRKSPLKLAIIGMFVFSINLENVNESSRCIDLIKNDKTINFIINFLYFL